MSSFHWIETNRKKTLIIYKLQPYTDYLLLLVSKFQYVYNTIFLEIQSLH